MFGVNENSYLANEIEKIFKMMNKLEESLKKRWTPDEIEALIHLMNDGKTKRQMAEILGRTYLAIRTKVSEVKREDFIAPILSAVPFIYSPPTLRWDEAPRSGPYKRAKDTLGRRHVYHPRYGNFIDGRKVTVQEMIKLAGIKIE